MSDRLTTPGWAVLRFLDKRDAQAAEIESMYAGLRKLLSNNEEAVASANAARSEVSRKRTELERLDADFLWSRTQRDLLQMKLDDKRALARALLPQCSTRGCTAPGGCWILYTPHGPRTVALVGLDVNLEANRIARSVLAADDATVPESCRPRTSLGSGMAGHCSARSAEI